MRVLYILGQRSAPQVRIRGSLVIEANLQASPRRLVRAVRPAHRIVHCQFWKTEVPAIDLREESAENLLIMNA